ALVGTRVYCPAAPENATLPNVTFFTRGGRATPYIPDMPEPSVQIDAWADGPIMARHVYKKLYDALQGIQNMAVVIPADILEDGIVILPAGTYYIVSAEEEVQGQDLVDVDIPGRYRCLSFWSVQVK
ncbi:MAG: hypothetical protein KKD77_23475, partial [Gammaproteobacteria bacterium]|nr:hypothetical protein [Gammaproteobacteria bacterium]